MPNGWIFKGRRGGCPFYIYLEDEDAAGIGAGLHVGPGEDQVSFIKISGADISSFSGKKPGVRRKLS